MQACLVVSELTLVNDESGFVFSFEHLWDDLGEWHDFSFNTRGKQMQGEIGCSERAGDCDALGLHFTLRKGPRRDDHGAVALADTASAWHQRILVLDIRICVERDRSD